MAPVQFAFCFSIKGAFPILHPNFIQSYIQILHSNSIHILHPNSIHILHPNSPKFYIQILHSISLQILHPNSSNFPPNFTHNFSPNLPLKCHFLKFEGSLPCLTLIPREGLENAGGLHAVFGPRSWYLPECGKARVNGPLLTLAMM